MSADSDGFDSADLVLSNSPGRLDEISVLVLDVIDLTPPKATNMKSGDF